MYLLHMFQPFPSPFFLLLLILLLPSFCSSMHRGQSVASQVSSGINPTICAGVTGLLVGIGLGIGIGALVM